MIRSHFDYVHDKVCWHRFVSGSLSGTCDNLRTFMGKYKIVEYEELKEYVEITERIKFLSEQFFDAEHDLIDLAIRYNVPFVTLLKGSCKEHEEFYTLLEEKAKQIDKKGVLLIRKN